MIWIYKISRYDTYTVLFVLLLISLNLSAFAAVLGITSTPVELLLGNSIYCIPNLTGNTSPISSTIWSQRKIFSNGSATPWQVLGNEGQVVVYGEVPVTYELKLVTIYSSIPGMPTPPSPTTHIRAWSVMEANGVRDESGFNQEIPIGNSLELVYWVQRGNQDCGTYISGMAQERLTNRFLTGYGQLPSTSWIPQYPSPTFRLGGGRIWDEHSADTTYWNIVPTPGIISSAIQELRIAWDDPWSNHYYQNLGSKQIVHRKVSSTNWQVTH